MDVTFSNLDYHTSGTEQSLKTYASSQSYVKSTEPKTSAPGLDGWDQSGVRVVPPVQPSLRAMCPKASDTEKADVAGENRE